MEFLSKKHFKYYINNNQPNFVCTLEKQQCSCIKSDGNRCRRKVVIGLEFCFQHLELKRHLKIKKSTIPNSGLGVFALDSRLPSDDTKTILFRGERNKKRGTGDFITNYNGETISNTEMEDRYHDNTAPYACRINPRAVVDAACSRGLGSMINSTTSYSAANCEFVQRRVGHQPVGVYVRARKNIRNGEELKVWYGKDYLFHEDGVRFSTR